jgi:hypothetical protein
MAMMSAMWLVFAGLLVGWLVGFAAGLGPRVWLVLVAAVLVFGVNVATARRLHRNA